MAVRADNDGPSVHATAWLLTGTLIFALFVPVLAQRGMNWDGLVYATISRNMAMGVCDAWHPQFTETLLPEFHEHPPLALWLESLMFRLCGDHFWVERLYSIITGLVTAAILVGLWRHLLRDYPEAACCSWLMIVVWVACSHWAYRNNLLENTLGIWTALSVYASLQALARGRTWIGWGALAGVAITAALVTKGPVGLFPVATPCVAWLAMRRVGLAKALLVQLLVVACCAGSFAVALAPEVSREYWEIYWRQQVMASLQAQRENLTPSIFGQLKILGFLARNLTTGAVIAGAIALASPRHVWTALGDRRLAGPLRFCLITALSASLPLVLCPKQHGHYTAPSWPFFGFALTLACLPAMLQLLPRLTEFAAPHRAVRLRWGAAAVALFALGYGVMHYGGCHRDGADIQASNAIAQKVGQHVVITVPHEVWKRLDGDRRFRLHAYLYRDHYVSVWQQEPKLEKVDVHMRLRSPAGALPTSATAVHCADGFECYPLARRESHRSAARVGIRR